MAIGDKRDNESWDESEFGLGEGMIDPVLRLEGRGDQGLPLHQELWEIAALPKTFDGSAAGLPGGERPVVEETPVPRLLPGETETDRG